MTWQFLFTNMIFIFCRIYSNLTFQLYQKVFRSCAQGNIYKLKDISTLLSDKSFIKRLHNISSKTMPDIMHLRLIISECSFIISWNKFQNRVIAYWWTIRGARNFILNVPSYLHNRNQDIKISTCNIQTHINIKCKGNYTYRWIDISY